MDKAYYKKYEPLFNSWYIKRLIGEGSFGQVYEIERNELDITYKAALKTITIPQNKSEIRSLMADGMTKEDVIAYYQSVVQELINEFVLLSKLKGNSNIVSYEDHMLIEHEDGIGWDILIRMELLTPMFDYMEQNELSKREIIKLGIDLCKALELCQRYNIIHRDVKPENIFISPTGNYKLGDFGVAKTVEETNSGLSRKGTYTYMAPEIYKGDAYGSSVDIYSLGIVMYRLLNENRTPFLPPYPEPITHNNKEDALMKRISGEELPMPVNGEGRLGEIVLKACAYEPKDRYSSAMQMRHELEAILYSEAEAELIYPDGDKAELKSLNYVHSINVFSSKIEQEAKTVAAFDSNLFEKEESVPEEDSEIEVDADNDIVEDVDSPDLTTYPEANSDIAENADLSDLTVHSSIEENDLIHDQNKKKKRLIIGAIIALLIIIMGVILLFPKKVDDIKGIDANTEIYVGEQLKPTYIINPESLSDEKIAFSVENENIISVTESGVIKAKNVGETILTMKTKGYQEDVTIHVIAKVKEISNVDDEITLEEGDSKTISPVLKPKKFADLPIIYDIEDEKIASVSKDGKIVAKKPGKTVLKITAGGYTKKVTINVTEYVEPTYSNYQQTPSYQSNSTKSSTNKSESKKSSSKSKSKNSGTKSNNTNSESFGEEYWE